MKKVIKKIMIYIAIYIIAFQSYAAVSVSDGSAFVLKSEHSININNISNKISQIENNFETRIDSIVSKYLFTHTKEGETIWQGEKQEICFDMRDFVYRIGASSGWLAPSSGSPDDCVMRTSVISYNGNETYWVTNAFSERRLVASCSKSGIATVKYKSNIQYGGSIGWGYKPTHFDRFTSIRPSRGFMYYTPTFKDYDTIDDYTNGLLYQLNTYFLISDDPPPGSLTNTVSFFVNKGDPIWFACYIINPFMKHRNYGDLYPKVCDIMYRDGLNITIY